MTMVSPQAFDAIYSAVEGLLPVHEDTHPLGCHNPRTDDRTILRAPLYRVVSGCSYDDAAAVVELHGRTVRRRRDVWIEAGVFDRLWAEVIDAYGRIVGLVLDDISVDGCITKAPGGGDHAGKSPVDRGKQGTKRSIAVDGRGVPLGFVCAGANKVDHQLLAQTLAQLDRFLLPELPSVHLDRGYDNKPARAVLDSFGADPRIAEKHTTMRVRSRQRWVVERTNAWHNQFGQLRRCTDRTARCVELSVLLANVIIIVRRLIARAYRYRI